MEDKKRDPVKELLFFMGILLILYFFLAYKYGDVLSKVWWSWQNIKLSFLQLFYSTEKMGQIQALIKHPGRDWTKVSIENSIELAGLVSNYFRWVIVPPIVFWAWKVSEKNPLNNLKHKHSMMTLVASEMKIWPHTKPITALNLIKIPNNKGEWASSMNPLEFAKEFKLLESDGKLNRDRAEKVFAAQLNKLWTGIDSLTPVQKALFAIFAASGNWDATNPEYSSAKGDARTGLNKLSISYFSNPKKLDMSWSDALIKKHIQHPEIQSIINSHAYIHTVLMSLLEYGRKNGVMPSSEFFWLRTVDRKLWYCLNNVGRNVAWTEVAGVFGHWLAEKTLEEPIMRPYTKKTIDAYVEALNNIKVKPKKY